MPLTRPLADLRRELQDILTGDLAAVLNALKDLLPERTDLHTSVLNFQARLKDANRERMRNTLSDEDYQRRVDTIRAECFDLIRGLEKEDFEVLSEPASAKATAGKYGSVLYRIPHKMPIRKPSICKVRVAIDADAQLDDLVLDDDVRLRERVQVSDMMRTELLDPENDVFSIRALSTEEQLVREEGYTQWLFSVTPRVDGEHQLLVKVSMLEYNPHLGKYVPREVSILETVTIVTEAVAPVESEELPLKSTGERFALTNSAAPSYAAAPEIIAEHTPPGIEPSFPLSAQGGQTKGLRALALFLAFLVVSTSATYAFTPQDTLDWWETRYLENTPQAYHEFIQTHSESEHRPQAVAVLKVLETKHLEVIQTNPTLLNIRQFLVDFFTSERLSEVKQVVDNHAELRAELLPELEIAYVQAVYQNTSPGTVRQFLMDFPKSERLVEVAQTAAAQPKVLAVVQPELEQAIIHKVENASTAAEVTAMLPALESVGSEAGMMRVEKAVAGKSFQKEVQEQLRKTRQWIQQRQGSSSSIQNSSISPAKKAANPQLEDADGDGVADQDDQCPQEKGLAKDHGCPPTATSSSITPAADLATILAKISSDMVTVKGGTFTMGCQDGRNKDCEIYEKPSHQVTLSDFHISCYEVTQRQWEAVMGENPSNFKGCPDCPVEKVSWDDVQAFLKKLNALTGKKYQLPTEAEWEYAACGGGRSQGFAYGGGNNIDAVAWYNSNSDSKTHPVGQKEANELGLYDMSGNVSEWCSDWYADYSAAAQTNPKGSKKGTYRVLRGGSWHYSPQYCRAAHRGYFAPTFQYDNIGFRVAASFQ